MTCKFHGMQFLVGLVLLCWVLVSTGTVLGNDLRGVCVAPDTEKRSCLVAADGYAVHLQNRSLIETKALAFSEAERKVLETAKKYIEETCKETGQKSYDLIWPEDGDSVRILQRKDYGLEDDDRYHVWVKAEVTYVFKPKWEDTREGYFSGEAAPLTVRVWTGKKNYRCGEDIEIYVRGNRDFYARIVNITSAGDIIQLLPNQFRNINRFEGRKTYKIPDDGDRFDLEVTAPYGQDRIVVYASEVPVGEVNMEKVGQDGLCMFRGTLEDLGIKTRGMTIVLDEPHASGKAEFYEAGWEFTTVE